MTKFLRIQNTLFNIDEILEVGTFKHTTKIDITTIYSVYIRVPLIELTDDFSSLPIKQFFFETEEEMKKEFERISNILIEDNNNV